MQAYSNTDILSRSTALHYNLNASLLFISKKQPLEINQYYKSTCPQRTVNKSYYSVPAFGR